MKPTTNFQDIVERQTRLGAHWVIVPPGELVTPQAVLDEVVRAELKHHGLEQQDQQLVGQSMVFPGRCELWRSRIYCAVTNDAEDPVRAAREMVAMMAEHGPGRIWFLLSPVHYVLDDNQVGARMMVNDAGVVEPMPILRSYYGHEKQAVAR